MKHSPLRTVAEQEFEEQEQSKTPRSKMEGQLLKYTNVMKGWQTRWFMLDPESGMLEYFEKEEHKKLRARGSVHLAASVVSPSEEDSQTFTVTAASGEAFKLRASDARERQHWVDRLRSTAEYHTANIAQHPAAYQKSILQSKEGTPSKRADPGGRRSHYSSQESVHSTPGKKGSPTSGLPPPFVEVQEYLTEAHDYSQTLSEKISKLPYYGEDCFMTGLDKDLLLLKATSGATLRCVEDCLLLLQSGKVVSPGICQSASAPERLSGVDKKTSPGNPPMQVDIQKGSPKIVPPLALKDQTKIEEINHDEEEEDTDNYQDSELGAVEEHKSVILHLLSQLKLGMDLTKVVLPTFILERRSLLEMFADCMAHPDSFLRINDLEEPEDRMLAVVEWYLASFHAGRQGSVAKKPYNPIIGETFHCSWRLPTGQKENIQFAESNVMASKDKNYVQLTYSAEQVSHHPPVSAFYFECPQKQMYMNGSIWTKSKFMGMAIGVVMIGKLTLRLLQHDEEYVFGLPNAYARSILTVPWVELGDKVTMTCEKNNLVASILFHTKPFYGGKLHRVTAEVKNSLSGLQLCKVQGEWNGSLEFVYSNGKSKVIETLSQRIWHKRVRPLEKQGDFESRRLWQHVTNALQLGDVSTATEHKRLLEERQREGERHRKELGQKFPTKFFHEEGDAWVYNHLLQTCKNEVNAA